MVKNYKVKSFAISLSKEQIKFAKDKYDIDTMELQDYRVYANNETLHNTFDRIVSVGMIEHVGSKNYRNFFGNSQIFVIQIVGDLRYI